MGKPSDITLFSSSQKLYSKGLNILEMCPTEAFYHILDFLKPIEIDRIIRGLNKNLYEKASSQEFWETRMLNRYNLMDLLYIELYVIAERRSKGRIQKGVMMGTRKEFIIRTVSLETTNAGKDDGVPTSCLREISLLSKIRHPNILVYVPSRKVFIFAVLMVFTFRCYGGRVKGSQIQVVSEYIKENLSMRLEFFSKHPLNRVVIQDLMRQLFTALSCLHKNGILHRNIKPDNILLQPGDYPSGLQLKLGDLAMARSIDFPLEVYTPEDPKERERSYREQRRLYNRAPEVILRQPVYGVEIDIWSVGCIFLELALGYPPFRCESEIGLLLSTLQLCGTPDVSIWNRIGASFRSFLKLPMWKFIDFRAIAATLVNDQTRAAGHLSPYLVGYDKQVESVNMLLQFGTTVGVNALHLLERLLILPGAFRVSAREALDYPYFTHPANDASLHPEVNQWINVCCCRNESKKKHVFYACSLILKTTLTIYQRIIYYQCRIINGLYVIRKKRKTFWLCSCFLKHPVTIMNVGLSSNQWRKNGFVFTLIKHLFTNDHVPWNSMDQTISNNKLQYYIWAPFDYTEEIISKETLATRMSPSECRIIDHDKKQESQQSGILGEQYTETVARSQQSDKNQASEFQMSQTVGNECFNKKSSVEASQSTEKEEDVFNSPTHCHANSRSTHSSCEDPETECRSKRLHRECFTRKEQSGTICSKNCLCQKTSFRNPTEKALCSYQPQVVPCDSGVASHHFIITPGIRLHVINHIFGVQPHFYLKSQTVHLAVSYFDKYISLLSEAYKTNFQFLSLNEVLPLALTCVKIADLNNEISKEYYKQDNIAEYTSFYVSILYNIEELGNSNKLDVSHLANILLQNEKKILNALHFDLSIPTLYSFLNMFLSISKLLHMKHLVDYCHYLADLSLYSHHMVSIRPSLKAQVVLLFGCCTLFRPLKQGRDEKTQKQITLEPCDPEYSQNLILLLNDLYEHRNALGYNNTVWKVLDCIAVIRDVLMNGRRYFKLEKIENVKKKHSWASRIGLSTPLIPLKALRIILPLVFLFVMTNKKLSVHFFEEWKELI
ncbi:uncharacterized protein LOC128884030 isoform X2 [Hylaeus volcanicus]|uniref:uncharacterized protein LOC128884030 isoform X2 n=1 Tax=Hylaeus volcanicus TaxID=313075 RepID=UPI0023B7BA4F|nr:uncharacterized protein LOC128884030 isoform X2 [Hylaeus volcanicus]